MTGLAAVTVGHAAVVGAIIGVCLWVVAVLTVGVGFLTRRVKDGVSRRTWISAVVRNTPWAMRTQVDWRQAARLLPALVVGGVLASTVLYVFVVGLAVVAA